MFSSTGMSSGASLVQEKQVTGARLIKKYISALSYNENKTLWGVCYWKNNQHSGGNVVDDFPIPACLQVCYSNHIIYLFFKLLLLNTSLFDTIK